MSLGFRPSIDETDDDTVINGDDDAVTMADSHKSSNTAAVVVRGMLLEGFPGLAGPEQQTCHTQY